MPSISCSPVTYSTYRPSLRSFFEPTQEYACRSLWDMLPCGFRISRTELLDIHTMLCEYFVISISILSQPSTLECYRLLQDNLSTNTLPTLDGFLVCAKTHLRPID